MARLLLLLMTTAFVLSCRKEECREPGGDVCFPFTGFSMVNNVGAPIQPPDTTDWRTTERWCSWVEALFADRPAVTWADTPLAEPATAGYPNPCSDVFRLWLGDDPTDYADLRIISSAGKVVFTMDSITAPQIEIQAGNLDVTDQRLFRVYYRIVHPDGSAHRGHGDMKKVP